MSSPARQYLPSWHVANLERECAMHYVDANMHARAAKHGFPRLFLSFPLTRRAFCSDGDPALQQASVIRLKGRQAQKKEYKKNKINKCARTCISCVPRVPNPANHNPNSRRAPAQGTKVNAPLVIPQCSAFFMPSPQSRTP